MTYNVFGGTLNLYLSICLQGGTVHSLAFFNSSVCTSEFIV